MSCHDQTVCLFICLSSYVRYYYHPCDVVDIDVMMMMVQGTGLAVYPYYYRQVSFLPALPPPPPPPPAPVQ